MTTLQFAAAYRPPLKKGLNAANNWVKIAVDGIAAQEEQQEKQYCAHSGRLNIGRLPEMNEILPPGASVALHALDFVERVIGAGDREGGRVFRQVR